MEMVEIIDSCRMCLESHGEFTSLERESETPNTSYLDAYNFCTGLNADLNDSLPNIICQDCAINLIFVYDFIQKAIQSAELLRQIVKKGQNLSQIEIEEEDTENVPLEECLIDDTNQVMHEDKTDLDSDEEQPNDDDNKIDFQSFEFEYAMDKDQPTIKLEQDEYSPDTNEKVELCSEYSNHSFQSEELSQHSRDDHDADLETQQPQENEQESEHREPAKLQPRKTWCCEICGKVFATKQKLSQHNLVHTKEKNYPCSLCPKRFATIYRHRDHMNSHENIRKYDCEFCDQKFSSKSTLVCHLRRHTGERPYKCEICGKAFTQASIMKTHTALHTGKTVECKLCSKKFSRPSHLILHQRSHTGERPYLCMHCPNRYKQKSHLDRHLDTHLGVKHTCEVCGKSYTKKSSLNHHKVVHLAAKPFKCVECKLDFTTKDKYNRHLKNVHKTPSKEKSPPKDSLPEVKILEV